MELLIENRKARAENTLLEKFEAGIRLSGSEVKMVRLRRGSLVGSYVRVIQGDALLINMQIPPYPFARVEDYDPKRTRKLLLHKNEILKLQHAQDTKGLSLIPFAVILTKNLIKVQLAIARGKKLYERRDELRKRDLQRESEKDLKERQ
ncbi:MAG TPA: SsrA-binding protein SmpB [Patescibacteria group bacterium]|nr:SsrA-binding protein SmpB [Patescibacteria group bacterium]